MAQEFNKKSIEEKLEEASQSIEKSTFINQDISDKQIKNLTLTSQVFKNCNFYVSSLYGCNFDKCDFIDCNFSAADFLNVKFFNCMFNKCNFDKSKMQDVLFDDCTKINCSMNNINIIENVIGINIEENQIITENNNSTLSAYEYHKEHNGTFIHIALDPEMGPKTYRVIIGDKYNPSIISDTFEFTDNINDIIEDVIYDLIDIAISKTNNSQTKTSLKKLKSKSYNDIFVNQLQFIEKNIQKCLSNIKNYQNTDINLIYIYLTSAIKALEPLLNIKELE